MAMLSLPDAPGEDAPSPIFVGAGDLPCRWFWPWAGIVNLMLDLALFLLNRCNIDATAPSS